MAGMCGAVFRSSKSFAADRTAFHVAGLRSGDPLKFGRDPGISLVSDSVLLRDAGGPRHLPGQTDGALRTVLAGCLWGQTLCGQLHTVRPGEGPAGHVSFGCDTEA